MFDTVATPAPHRRISPSSIKHISSTKVAIVTSVLILHNQRRRHSTLGQISPAAFERRTVAEGVDAMGRPPRTRFPIASTPIVFLRERRTNDEERATQRNRPPNRTRPSRGFISYPLMSDVQDDALCQELEQHGLDRADAQHVTQAVCNACDVFLTRDRKTIIKPHRAWLEARFPNLKIRLPSELVAELRQAGMLPSPVIAGTAF